jgi:hypothetical protein
MALIGNYTVRNKSPGRFLAGGSTAGTNEGQARSNFNRTSMRNVHYMDGSTTAQPLIGYPTGGYKHVVWMMPYLAGNMKSYNECQVSISSSGSGAEGLGGSATTTLTLSASALGGLIAGGVGTATISILANGDVVATTTTTGSSVITIGAVADPGALGWLGGVAPITIDADLIAYAIGHMQGTTEESGLTVNGIVNGVWNAIAANYNDPGTTGNKLNSASAAGDPWTADLPGSYPEGTAGYILGTLDAEALADAIMTDPRLLTVAKFLGLK